MAGMLARSVRAEANAHAGAARAAPGGLSSYAQTGGFAPVAMRRSSEGARPSGGRRKQSRGDRGTEAMRFQQAKAKRARAAELRGAQERTKPVRRERRRSIALPPVKAAASPGRELKPLRPPTNRRRQSVQGGLERGAGGGVGGVAAALSRRWDVAEKERQGLSSSPSPSSSARTASAEGRRAAAAAADDLEDNASRLEELDRPLTEMEAACVEGAAKRKAGKFVPVYMMSEAQRLEEGRAIKPRQEWLDADERKRRREERALLGCCERWLPCVGCVGRWLGRFCGCSSDGGAKVAPVGVKNTMSTSSDILARKKKAKQKLGNGRHT
jgi:hypothetical protein